MKGAEDYDLVLRVFDEAGAGRIGHLPDVLYHRLKNGGRWHLPAGELVETGKLAVESHLSRSGIRGAVEHGLFPASYRLRYEHDHKPKVSILVAVRDQIETVQRCIESVLGATRYPDYELLLIDNDSTHPASLATICFSYISTRP
jgi:O-antigen biosynthesis protein